MSDIRLKTEDARILAIAGPAHGDILLATPLLASLRRAAPNAGIDVLVYRGQEGILEGNPDVNEVLSASKHPDFREYLHLLRRIFRRYDLAISTKHTDRAIWYAFVAGRSRIAIVPPGKGGWKRRITHASVPYDHETTHTILQNRSLAALLGIESGADIRLPRTQDSRNAAAELLPAGLRGRPYAVLHVVPGLPHKRWTIAGWIAVGAFLESRGISIVLTGSGSSEELEYLRAVAGQLPPSTVSLAGKLRFSEVTALVEHCAVYVGTDTVVTHIAAAAGAPTIALFGPESPLVWGPWPRGHAALDHSPYRTRGDQSIGNVTVLQSAIPCTTCRQGHCLKRSEKRDPCSLMTSLESDRVVAALARLPALAPDRIAAIEQSLAAHAELPATNGATGNAGDPPQPMPAGPLRA